jgi:hypothetical protein
MQGFLSLGGEILDMNTRTKALALLSIIAIAGIAGSLLFVMQSVKADPTAAVASDSELTPSTVNATGNSLTGFYGFGGGPIMMGEPGFAMGHRGMDRGLGGFGTSAIQVSSDYIANVTNIVNNDSDVQNLLNQGYNITSIRPVISTTIDGNGNLVTSASTAKVLLQGNNGSRSLVTVDLSQAKVTKIVTLNVTEIDK